jgi:hypothetical protein
MAQDDLNVLSVFLAVAEQRSFTKAAKHLSVQARRKVRFETGVRRPVGAKPMRATDQASATHPTD